MAKSAKPNTKNDLFSGGNGASPETAIIIGAATNAIGVPAEYAYVMEKHGLPHVGWKLISQSVMEAAGRHYDAMCIALGNGQKRTYYFDISRFYPI